MSTNREHIIQKIKSGKTSVDSSVANNVFNQASAKSGLLNQSIYQKIISVLGKKTLIHLLGGSIVLNGVLGGIGYQNFMKNKATEDMLKQIEEVQINTEKTDPGIQPIESTEVKEKNGTNTNHSPSHHSKKDVNVKNTLPKVLSTNKIDTTKIASHDTILKDTSTVLSQPSLNMDLKNDTEENDDDFFNNENIDTLNGDELFEN